MVCLAAGRKTVGHTLAIASAVKKDLDQLYGFVEASKQSAKTIAEYLQQGRTVHVCFNNDAECAAPFNALTLQALLQHRSWIYTFRT
ncbi:DUF72 domain-containing protein [Methylotuvimicrobium alcaliphilum]|uniref:DUF72 domain-containing protein n=1 Tax=Methylotuvimicrobium alcaliphilum TaxID=271065 RepID=UPI0013921FA5